MTVKADLSDNLVAAMNGAAVLVAGDIMLDRFVYGSVDRISPEAPIPVLRIARENRMLGGAGNVVSNLTGLGAQPLLLAVVGPDEEGRNVRALIESRDVSPDGLLTVPGRPTTIKTRFLAGHQQLLRTDSESAADLPEDVADRLLAQAERYAEQAKAIILSDYGKGVLTRRITDGLIAIARRRGLPVLVDPKKTDYARYRGADIVTPNRKELSEATGGMPATEDAEVVAAAQSLIRHSGIGAVIATRSQDGMSLIRAGENGGFQPPLHYRSSEIEVFDVSGAGDTVIATVAAALAGGAAIEDAVALANLAGGIVVRKAGTAPIRGAELADAVRQGLPEPERAGSRSLSGSRGQAGILLPDEAEEQVRRWQSRGLKVGFTNGCFDIVHPGHVRLMAQARAACDRLVVALNCDASVKRLKGEGRPVNDEQSRAAVMAALGSVDMVLLFGADAEEDDKPVRLIKKLLPDIIFKGGDYTPQTVVGGDFVESYGGEIRIIPLEEGYSTTNIVSRLKKDAVG